MMKNGVQVSNSNIKTHVNVLADPEETLTATFNWVGYLGVGETISFQQSCNDPDIGIVATASGTPPATPSIIISIARIN